MVTNESNPRDVVVTVILLCVKTIDESVKTKIYHSHNSCVEATRPHSCVEDALRNMWTKDVRWGGRWSKAGQKMLSGVNLLSQSTNFGKPGIWPAIVRFGFLANFVTASMWIKYFYYITLVDRCRYRKFELSIHCTRSIFTRLEACWKRFSKMYRLRKLAPHFAPDFELNRKCFENEKGIVRREAKSYTFWCVPRTDKCILLPKLARQ